MQHTLFVLLALSLSPLAQGADLRQQVRDAAQRIAIDVDTTSATDAKLADILSQLQQLDAQLGGASSVSLYCEPDGPSFSYVTRLADGHRYSSSSVQNDLCHQLIAATANDLLCAPDGPSFANLVKVDTAVSLTASSVQNAICLAAIQHSTRQLVCAPDGPSFSYVTSIADGTRRGSSILNDQCFTAIGN